LSLSLEAHRACFYISELSLPSEAHEARFFYRSELTFWQKAKELAFTKKGVELAERSL
jgi:hypothetical protein